MQISDLSQIISRVITISLWTCFHQYKNTAHIETIAFKMAETHHCIIKRKFINGIKESNAPKHLELHYQVEVHTQFENVKA